MPPGATMQIARRNTITLAIAAIVPLLLLGIFQVASTLQLITRETENQTLARAVVYQALVDGELAGDLGALSVLASSQFIRSGAWRQARERAAAVARDRPHWTNVILTDVSAGQQIWETTAPFDERIPARPGPLSFANSGAASSVGGFYRASSQCGCIALEQRIVVGDSTYILTVERSVADFQNLLLAAISAGEIAALVDRQGLFLARTAQYESRLGTPATQYVRDAVARGGQDIYTGTTYEGLENRTAYTTSKLSGWSTHIAVPATSYILLSAGYFTFTALAVAIALLFAAAVIWYGVRDLSARRQAERARMLSQKLEAIGRLSGAVAHDFNNLLTIMVACLRHLGKSDDKTKVDEVVREGMAAADRGAKLVSQLLTFAREKPIELDCVDLDKTIGAIRDLLARSLGGNIAFDVSVSRDGRYVRTNATQLELVLLNLAVNARDAMPNGGSFTVVSQLAPVRGYVDVSVRDTGVGMSEEVASRAFEPFFTTKAEGKGTGLGLSQAHLLMRESGGSLHLESAPGKGALFILRLPACEPPPV